MKNENDFIIKIRIVPSSSKNEIILEDEFVKVKVTAQPIENKANKALIEFLSKTFRISKSSIKIIKGETSKDKTLLFSVSDKNKREEVISRLTK